MIRFGASTRSYVLREKPAMPSAALKMPENVSDNMEQDNDENTKGGLLGLPESDTELDVRVSNSLLTVNPGHARLVFLKFEQSFECQF